MPFQICSSSERGVPGFFEPEFAFKVAELFFRGLHPAVYDAMQKLQVDFVGESGHFGTIRFTAYLEFEELGEVVATIRYQPWGRGLSSVEAGTNEQDDRYGRLSIDMWHSADSLEEKVAAALAAAVKVAIKERGETTGVGTANLDQQTWGIVRSGLQVILEPLRSTVTS